MVWKWIRYLEELCCLASLVASVMGALVYEFGKSYSMVGKRNVAKYCSPLSSIESPKFYTRLCQVCEVM